MFRAAEEAGIDLEPQRSVKKPASPGSGGWTSKTSARPQNQTGERQHLVKRKFQKEGNILLDVNFFDELRIGLATAEDIRQWSHGEVKKPETINYRTPAPEKDDSSVRRFGPTRTGSATAASTSGSFQGGIIWRALRRRGHSGPRSVGSGWAAHRAGRPGHPHSVLQGGAEPVWLACSTTAPKDPRKIRYFAAYMITWVDDEARHRDHAELRGADRGTGRGSRNAATPTWTPSSAEADLAELEAEGAKGDVKRKVREGAAREETQFSRAGATP